MNLGALFIRCWENGDDENGNYERQKQFIAEYRSGHASFHDEYADEIRRIADDELETIAANMAGYIVNIYEDGDNEHRNRFILFNALNKRKSREHGFAGFGDDGILMKDIAIACLLELFDIRENVKKPAIFNERFFGRGYHSGDVTVSERMALRESRGRAPLTSFRPADEFEVLEKYSFLNMHFGLSEKWFPYFRDELVPLYEKVTPIAREFGCACKDSIVRLAESMIGFHCEAGLTLELDYGKSPIEARIEPRIREERNGNGDGSWSISNILGCCAYRLRKEGRYPSADIKITLYMGNIRQVAKDRGMDPYFLLLVTYIHELSHFIYFAGRPILGKQFYPIGKNGIDLSRFGSAEFHEAIAQFLTRMLCRYDVDLARAFDLLNEIQSDEYHAWEKLTAFTQTEIIDKLVKISLVDGRKDLGLLLSI